MSSGRTGNGACRAPVLLRLRRLGGSPLLVARHSFGLSSVVRGSLAVRNREGRMPGRGAGVRHSGRSDRGGWCACHRLVLLLPWCSCWLRNAVESVPFLQPLCRTVARVQRWPQQQKPRPGLGFPSLAVP